GGADQQHHPGCLAPQLAHGTGEERPAAPDEDHGAEHCGDPGGASWWGVAEQVGEHRAEHDRGDSEGEHDPEQPAELRDVVPVTGVAAMAAMAAVALVALVALV